MILVDTSVIIGWFKKQDNLAVKYFEKIVESNNWGIADLTFHEVLQGASTEAEYDILNNYLSTQKIYYAPKTIEFYRATSKIYFELRKKGVTIRNSPDTIIAGIAIENKLKLLHNDKDFEIMAQYVKELETVKLD